ncbi:MAG: tetratricopeptide repeat protein [Chitinophagaceae bacterium]|nr:tetratricopeptide repeat protein [Chitinophagaceae bacterium]
MKIINIIGLIWLIGCFLSSASAQPQPSSLLHKTYAQRAPLLFSFYVSYLRDHQQDTGRVNQYIADLQKLASENSDDDLHAEAEFMQIHKLFYQKAYAKGSVLKQLRDLHTKARSDHRQWLMARIESLAALTCFSDAYNYELGFIHFKRMDDVIRTLPISEFPDKQNCYYQMGHAYYEFAEWENAIRYFNEGLRENPDQPVFHFFKQIHNMLGLCYQKLQRYDSADYHFKQVVAIAKKEPESFEAWEGIATGNLGYNLYLQKRYAEARPLLEKDVEIAENFGDFGLAVGSLVPLANIALGQNETALAKQLGEKARDYTIKSGQFYRWEKVYPLLGKLAALEGNRTLSAQMLDSALWAKDSVARRFNAMQMARAAQKIALEKQEATLMLLATEKRLKKWERNILLVCLGGLLAASGYVFYKQRKKARLKQQELKDAQKELEDASRQLELFTRNILEKNQLIESLSQKAGTEQAADIENLRQSTILTEEDWKRFRTLFEKVHSGYLERLMQKAPQLTAGEIRFATLSKLNIGNKEMAAMLGVGPEAIRQYRSRMRKKLALNESEGLENWLNCV